MFEFIADVWAQVDLPRAALLVGLAFVAYRLFEVLVDGLLALVGRGRPADVDVEVDERLDRMIELLDDLVEQGHQTAGNVERIAGDTGELVEHLDDAPAHWTPPAPRASPVVETASS